MKFASLLSAGITAVSSVAVAVPQADSSTTNIGSYPGTIGASAASASPSASPNASSTYSAATGAATHFISVGKGNFKFTPDSTEASVGDTVIFQFYPANHSVARAEYEHPCVGWEKFHHNDPGMFFSGFEPVAQILPNPPQFAITINNTDPIFFYCTAPGSCIDYQMVGVINPPSPDALQNQKKAAAQSTFMLQPGEPFPPESNPSTTVPGVVDATSTPASGGGNPPAGHGLSTGAIVGIAVGSAAAVVLAVLLSWLLCRTRSLNKTVMRASATVIPSMRQASDGPESQPFQADGAFFVPATAETTRNSGMSSPPPPGYARGNGALGGPPMQQHGGFAELEGGYQRPYPGTEQNRDAAVAQKPVVSGPYEMYAPMEPSPRSP